MPEAIAAKIEQAGGIWQALITVLPELEGIPRASSATLPVPDFRAPIPGARAAGFYVFDILYCRRRGRYLHRALPDGIPRALLACRLGLDDGEQERCPA